MNYFGDYHTHTNFSFDAGQNGNTPELMAEAALKAGLTEIALTDHLEVNSEVEGLYPKFMIEERQKACLAAKEKYAGKISVLVGIELGQMTQYPELSRDYLDKYKFDFVIGSLHNIRNCPDFALIDFSAYKEADFLALWERYLAELYEMTCFGCFDTVAHLTYPMRYYEKVGYRLDITKYRVQISQILKSIISHDMALEVNTSGYRQGMGRTLPDREIIDMYRALGGEKITLGSDAHFCRDVGADFARAREMLAK